MKFPGWRKLVILGATTIACLAAWLLPESKPAAVAGRLGFEEFMLALAASGLLVCVTVVGALPPARRRLVAFRGAAVGLGVTAAVLTAEGIAFLLPVRHPMDNPFYLYSGQGTEASEELPYERPAHLHWEGLSRGDLAILNHDADPYATHVTFVTDHEGFHNSRDLTRADLIFIGDSFTEAANLAEEESFVWRMAAARGQTARNLGRAGYTGPTELIVLRKYGLKCRPKFVIWQLTEANDLNDALVYQNWVTAGRPPYRSVRPPEPASSRESWKEHSPTWRLFCWLRKPPLWRLRGTFEDRDGTVHQLRFLDLPTGRQSPVDHPGWPILALSLREGAMLLRAEKIPLLVLHIPMKARGLGPAVRWDPEIAAKSGPSPDLPEANTLAAHLRKLCDELKVPFLDATPELRAAAAAGDLVYQPFDTHLSAIGHQVVTAALVRELRKMEK